MCHAYHSGLRYPQVIDRRTGKFEMDFVVLKQGNTINILNAISPALTCSMAIADHILETQFDLDGRNSGKDACSRPEVEIQAGY